MKEALKNSYNRDSDNYEDKFTEHQYVKYQTMLVPLFELLKTSKAILDHGCGTGLLNQYLKENNINLANYIGVDFSVNMLKHAMLKELLVVAADINRLPFPDNSFNFITSFTVLKILETENYKNEINELFRVLQPEGICIITVLKQRFTDHFIELLRMTGFSINNITPCGQDTGIVCKKE